MAAYPTRSKWNAMPRTSLLLLSLALSAPVWAANAPPVSATAKAMATAYVDDFKDMVRSTPDANPDEVACIERIPATAVADAMQEVIAQSLSTDEQAEMERFYASPEGLRLLAIYRRWGDKRNPASDAELEEVLPIIRSPVQTKLFDATSFQSLGSIQAMNAIAPLLARCLASR